MSNLTFEELRKINRQRCEDKKTGFGKSHSTIEEWSLSDWSNAIAGECGELCNLTKKIRRGENVPIEKLMEEAGGVLMYLDLFCSRIGLDLETVARYEFNRVSEKIGSPLRLGQRCATCRLSINECNCEIKSTMPTLQL